MEKENTVSLWVGNLNNAEELNEYVLETYDDDGDMTSPFITDFEIDYYDEDCREALFITSDDKYEIFKDFSYSQSFINEMTGINFGDYNCYILLYNYEYDESVKEKGNFRFIKVFTYQ